MNLEKVVFGFFVLLAATLNFPRSVYGSASGFYVIDRENHRIRFVDQAQDPGGQPGPVAPTPDFSGDGKVDFTDFVAFAGQFGKTSDSSTFNAAFDLNGDNAISFPDFLIFAAAFGS